MLEPALERRSGLAPTLAAILVLAGVATLPLAIPVLPPESLVAYTRTIGIEVPAGERHEQGALPQGFADMHGWQELVDTVRCRWCMPYQNDAPIHLARGLKVPLHQLWQEIKLFM